MKPEYTPTLNDTQIMWDILKTTFNEQHHVFVRLEDLCMELGRSGCEKNQLIDTIMRVASLHFESHMTFSQRVAESLGDVIHITDWDGNIIQQYNRADALVTPIKFSSLIHELMSDLAKACIHLGEMTTNGSLQEIFESTRCVEAIRRKINDHFSQMYSLAMVSPLVPIDIFSLSFCYPYENHPHNIE